jgi:preprotein translocase subunit SecD
LALTTAGAERFAQITGNNINRRLAIVFDGKVISAPVIKSRISGIGVITGDFSEEEVARIVKALNRPVAGGQFRAK